MDNLLPCPFCGGESLLRDRYINGVANTKHYIRECRHCKATFANWYRSIKKANEAWNRRADAVPVAHGEWINKPKTCVFICSMCGREVKTFHTNDIKVVNDEYPFCHCGADMRRESEDA